MLKAPQIISQRPNILFLRVPSRSKPKETRIVKYESGVRGLCDCPGDYWFKVKGEEDVKMCRHHKMTTIRKALGDPMGLLIKAMAYARDRGTKLCVAWGHVFCQFPEHRNDKEIHCTSCPLYPETCNIHPIMHGRNRKPEIWKLQTAIYNDRRKDAQKIIKKILREVNSEKSR